MVFSRSWWSISFEASSHRRPSKQLCGRMEIPCWVAFTCSRKATLNWLKALLKVVNYANLRHGVQMFSQISCIPDLIRKFWGKMCCLYAGVYGIWKWNTMSVSLEISLGTLFYKLINDLMFSERGKQFRKQCKLTFPQMFFDYKVNFCTSSHWMSCKQIAGMKTNKCSLAVRPSSQMVSGRFNTKSFRYKSFRYNSKSIRFPSKVNSVHANQSHFSVKKTLRYLAFWNYYVQNFQA